MKPALLCGTLALVMGAATPVLAQPDSAICPSGNISVIRTSKIKAGGTLAGFQKAFADHQKWYADHGYPQDRFSWATMLSYDRTANKMSASPDTVVTFHTNSSDVPPTKHDAAWDAYVAEYNANSEIVNTMVLCVTK